MFEGAWRDPGGKWREGWRQGRREARRDEVREAGREGGKEGKEVTDDVIHMQSSCSYETQGCTGSGDRTLCQLTLHRLVELINSQERKLY